MQYSRTDLKRFETLLTDVATRLMSVCAAGAQDVTEAVLSELVEFFAADTVFLRRHDLTDRHSRVVALSAAAVGPRPTASRRLRPKTVELRGAGPMAGTEPDGRADPAAPIHFDADPVLAATENQVEPIVTRADQWLGATGRIRNVGRADGGTVATVPLIHGSETVGILGVVDGGTRQWQDHELRTLSTIGTLFAHLWGRLEAERKLDYQVYNDELTGLPNRRKLSEVIEEIPEGREASLLVIDIDNMKVINDGLDFETGNRFIEGLGKRLVSILRPSSIVARLAGDQYAVLVLDTPPAHVERLANRLVNQMSETLQIDEEVGLARSVSIGVAHNYITQSNQELLSEADAALHQAKRDGKKRMAVFDDEMRAKIIDGFEVEIELRQALERGEFTVHYQPEVDLETGEIRAVEALLRWNHPRRGLLTAGAFIETAEESGLVVEIGDHVLRQAIAQLAQWSDIHPELEMWINVSPAQLMSRDVASQVQKLLDEFGVRPELICLEVTEHVVLGDLDSTTGVLRRLRDMGIKLALDDFGTGYSSMKQLKQLPITALKIDMTFVAGLGVSDHDSAIVDAAINLAAAFNLGTVAEGVETHQQVTELRKRGCRAAQGFLLARPAAPEQISELLGRPVTIDQPV